MQLPIYFFGDTHFKPLKSQEENEKIAKFSQFLDSISINNAKGSLFIMGDCFDYYLSTAIKTLANMKRYYQKLKR